jgi:hypothetical protein
MESNMFGFDMINLAIGAVLLVATGWLFVWGIPKDGQPSRIPSKWGMGTAFPIVLMLMGLGGCILVAKGIFP